MPDKRFRPHTVMVQVRGVADDGDTLEALDLQTIAVPFAIVTEWMTEGLAKLVEAAGVEINGGATETALKPTPNRAQRRSAK